MKILNENSNPNPNPNNIILKCSAYKNKNKNVQCSNNRKNDLLFCGKHKNSKEIFNNENNENSINSINSINNILNNNNGNTNVNTNLINNNIISKQKRLKNLEKNQYYNDYLNIRKIYIKENTKHIELIDYIENNKLDTYPLSRINESLEYYKLIKIKDCSKFLQAINNTEKLKSFFDILLKGNKYLPQLIILQRFIKKALISYKKKIHGPALYNRALCVNDVDFFTLDEIKDIPNNDFFSFSDEKNFIYGFHIDSIIQLIFKSDENYFEQFNKKIKNKYIVINNNKIKICYQQFIKLLYNHYNKIKILNPYTRSTIVCNDKLNAIRLYAQNTYDINKVEEIIEIVDIKISVRNKCLNIFQKIDFFGYQTDINWLYDQNQTLLKVFYKKLALLWNFEFGLNNEARYKIARSYNIFVNLHDIMISKQDKYTLLDKILDTVNLIVSNGETNSDKQSGCIIILYALAFINNRCILANPWLS